VSQRPNTSPEGMSRAQLYENWLAWVRAHMGSDPQMVEIAANAAADAAVRGEGFNGAAEAARKAWVDNAPRDKTLWRPPFWKLLVTNMWFWVLLALIIATPFVYVTAIGVVILLPVVGWQIYKVWRLSTSGIVVPGFLVDVKSLPGRDRGFQATYKYEHDGPHSVAHMYQLEDSVRNDVLILFDPNHSWIAMVMPEVLNPGS
jgi:hypothetical protein